MGNTMEIAAKLRLSHWARIIREQGESGLSVAAFCRREGFHENRYYYWQKKLREVACEHMPEIKELLPETGRPKAVFTEVKVSEYSESMHRGSSHDIGAIRLEIYGVTLSANNQYSPANIAAILKELSRPC